ncbi:preprotein translocase subunit SecE [Acidiferrimicrobium sp. IK]|uniref:preprotein translocase subunit SecE n=1 Tax=Acidiferrimicrobium sp. IK TaxID=2871700 RepID=UPI0021CB48C0|nr:preprotein translocase subunit SecE [Acidiferrimicrobium sp. IK]MCU4183313.1 preprotein translocase subunit SecE [Acidiferrimicrobium sp. IK]
MNRQQRRSAQRSGQGSEDTSVAPVPAEDVSEVRPRAAQAVTGRRRTTPRQFLHEVNVEMRKVAWPTRSETINYSSVVLVTLILVMALIFGLDTGFSQVSLYLFK